MQVNEIPHCDLRTDSFYSFIYLSFLESLVRLAENEVKTTSRIGSERPEPLLKRETS